jgi:hypothetical protein
MAIHTLNTVLLNILCNEGEEKFRRLRRANPKLQSAGVLALLSSVGFVAEGDFLHLPAGVVLPEAVIARVGSAHEALGAPPPPPAQSPPPAAAAGAAAGGGGGGSPDSAEYKKRQAELAKARAEKEAEKQRVLAEMERDRREFEQSRTGKPVTGSSACAKGKGGFSKLCVRAAARAPPHPPPRPPPHRSHPPPTTGTAHAARTRAAAAAEAKGEERSTRPPPPYFLPPKPFPGRPILKARNRAPLKRL